MQAGKLGQVTNFTIIGATAITASISAWFCLDKLLGGDTVMLGGLHARLCHAFLVTLNILYFIFIDICYSSLIWTFPLIYLL